MQNLKPLCVDLDGTLIYTDMVQESIILLLKKNIFYLFLFPLWILKSFANFKHEIARRIDFDPSHLPYNSEVISYVKEQRALGRKTLLVTASDQSIAEKVGTYLGLFDEVIGSTAKESYSGTKKLKKLIELFGKNQFVYVGNAFVDMKVWPDSDEVVAVTNSQRLLKKIEKLNKRLTRFSTRSMAFRDYLNFFHVLRWRRNILIFVPLILDKQFHFVSWLSLIPGFFIFSLCTSSAAIVSDVFDATIDRLHPRKNKRPLASGKISIRASLAIAGVLFFFSFSSGLFYSFYFSEIILFYFIFSIIYTIYCKRFILLRVFGLMLLTLMPVFAGWVIR